MVMKQQNQSSVNLEIPGRRRRVFAYLLDLIINITIIWLIANIIIIFVEKNTLWNMLVWIKTLNNKYNSANIWQISLRYLIFYQTIPLFVYYFCRYYYLISWGFIKCYDCNEAKNRTRMFLLYICLSFSVIILINIIEIFFKCSTFIDKLLWIKRVYKKFK